MIHGERRCAIYTRKSSEEGLEQSFNSLDAQKEACAAYIKSQAHENWKPVKTAYDDGGFSGGSMERPALKRLLRDIEAGLVQVIVVYKVDRLTRSLSDFARIIEILDGHRASFVSVTQQFNTTTSMGRLTLNVLLSFAQFERELTGERIRDKVLASRQKGMWMGGYPSLGYDVRDRALVINPAEAEQVRDIYARYLKLGSVAALATELHEHEIRSKKWTTRKGPTRGGGRFGRGALYALLQNRLYLGEAVHKGKSYPGKHEAIIDPKLWERVQKKLVLNGSERTGARQTHGRALLTGLLFDDRGNAMTPSYTKKRNGSRYRYYVSQAVLHHRPAEAGSVRRIPAGAIEEVVTQQIVSRIADSEGQQFSKLTAAEQGKRLRAAMTRVQVRAEEVTIELAKGAGRQQKGGGRTKQGSIIRIPIRLQTRGGECLILSSKGNPQDCGGRADKTLIKAVARAWLWREALVSGKVQTVSEMASFNGLTERYVREVLPLAFLSPELIRTIIEGRQSRTLTLSGLCVTAKSACWNKNQRRVE